MAVQDGPYPFLNIGSVMGPVGKLLRVLQRNNELVLAEDLNDQGAMWLVLARYGAQYGIIIDQWARVFMNMLTSFGDMERYPCDESWFQGSSEDPQPPRNTRSNSTPVFLHFNGPAHEDETWLSCYKQFYKQFRKPMSAHLILDLDHGLQARESCRAHSQNAARHARELARKEA